MLIELSLYVAAAAASTSGCTAHPHTFTSGDKTLLVCTCPSVSSWTIKPGTTIPATGKSLRLDTTGFTAGNLTVVAHCPDGPVPILLTIGPMIPPAPIQYECAVTAPTGTIYPGDPVTITCDSSVLDPNLPLKATWTMDGGAKISGSGPVATVDTTGLLPGVYNAKVHAVWGSGVHQMVTDRGTPILLSQPPPPLVSCSAEPPAIHPGESSTITAVGNSPIGRPLSYTFTSSSGSLSSKGATATLKTTGAAPSGDVTITCEVKDDFKQTGSDTTKVRVGP